MSQSPRLTQLSRGSGCGCKIAPAVLQEILHGRTAPEHFPGLWVGNDRSDDAAVLDLGDGRGLVSTVDFFMPIVDDPFDFGRIAAANALSDVYAMGGQPVMALAILGFPVDKLSPSVAATILDGARAICEEAGIPLAGGHTIDAPEPLFGLSVNGLVSRDHLRTNGGARPGDRIYLTKPLGTGIVAAALKRDKADPAHVKAAVDSMTRLNTLGSRLGKVPAVHALTDVTGFGLLGHLAEVCESSGVSARIDYQNVPLLPGVKTYMDQFIFPDNTYRNWNSLEKKVSGIYGPEFIALCDPQTSGGLLVTIEPGYAISGDFGSDLWEIGLVVDRAEMLVEVH